jgi:hypothetical protein
VGNKKIPIFQINTERELKGARFFYEMDLVAGYGSEEETATVSVTLPELVL